MKTTTRHWLALSALATLSTASLADPVYLAGTSTPLASCPTCVVGTHLAEGPSGSVAGVGGSGIDAGAGSALDGARTYIWDKGYPGYVAGATISRGASRAPRHHRQLRAR